MTDKLRQEIHLAQRAGALDIDWRQLFSLSLDSANRFFRMQLRLNGDVVTGLGFSGDLIDSESIVKFRGILGCDVFEHAPLGENIRISLYLFPFLGYRRVAPQDASLDYLLTTLNLVHLDWTPLAWITDEHDEFRAIDSI